MRSNTWVQFVIPGTLEEAHDSLCLFSQEYQTYSSGLEPILLIQTDNNFIIYNN